MYRPRLATITMHMEIELFCTCQMPETYDGMVECDMWGLVPPQVCESRAIPAEGEQWN